MRSRFRWKRQELNFLKKKKRLSSFYQQTNLAERTEGKKRITTAEADIGGASPISLTVTSALPNAFGDSINCKHCKPGGSGTTSTTRESFTTGCNKQLPPIIDKFN